MTTPTEDQALNSIVDRLALVVTHLNGLSSTIINDEVSPADFGHDLSELEDKLAQVEATVSDLADAFEGAVPESVYTVVATEEATYRVWYLVTNVGSVAEAIEAYQRGQGQETLRKMLGIQLRQVDDAYQEV